MASVLVAILVEKSIAIIFTNPIKNGDSNGDLDLVFYAFRVSGR
jgi:hypothetical protein